MLFTAAGLIVGVEALGLIDPAATGIEIKILAEATLTVVLFSDASRIDLGALKRTLGIPTRLLGIGLPLTIGIGFLAALAVLGDLSWADALVLAIILAPTDAALGQAVVTSKRLPVRIRQSLNVESGLNDGICVPLFFIALAVALAEEGAIGDGAAATLVLEKIGYGVVGGVVAGAAAAAVVVSPAGAVSSTPRGSRSSRSRERCSRSASRRQSAAPGFIAAFVGGMVFGGLRRRRGGDVSYLMEQTGAVLAAITFVVFGAVLLGPALGRAQRGRSRSTPCSASLSFGCFPWRSRCSAQAPAVRPSPSSAGSGRAALPRSSSRCCCSRRRHSRARRSS